LKKNEQRVAGFLDHWLFINF